MLAIFISIYPSIHPSIRPSLAIYHSLPLSGIVLGEPDWRIFHVTSGTCNPMSLMALA